jgi:hypothetical protein
MSRRPVRIASAASIAVKDTGMGFEPPAVQLIYQVSHGPRRFLGNTALSWELTFPHASDADSTYALGILSRATYWNKSLRCIARAPNLV